MLLTIPRHNDSLKVRYPVYKEHVVEMSSPFRSKVNANVIHPPDLHKGDIQAE